MNIKLSFGKTLIIFGILTCLIGLVISMIGPITVNDPDLYFKKGDVITGAVLFFIGIFTIILGFLEIK